MNGTNIEHVRYASQKNPLAEPEFAAGGILELFHTPDQQGYATIITNEHLEHWPLMSRPFRLWLRRHLYELSGEIPSDRKLRAHLATLEGHALFDGPEHPVYCRLAEANGTIYLDLTNDRWQAVEITADGWQVLDDPPIKFRRPRGMAPLPNPERGGSLDDLRIFLNIATEADWILVTSWLVSALRPVGPYPILILHGEQGSAKSTTARLLRRLIDPNESLLRSIPRNERDLMIASSNSWIQAFDNLSQLPTWFADALCRLATGGGFATRRLTTDADEILFDAQRPVICTSIEELVTRGDVLSRAIVVDLPYIPPRKRRVEKLLWCMFEPRWPSILGALLDIVSAALRQLHLVDVDSFPRMADFAHWACAAAPACQWNTITDNGELKNSQAFIHAYSTNREAANALVLETAIAPALQRLTVTGPWSGTHSDLLDVLRTLLGSRQARELPSTARALSAELDRLVPSLRAVGVHLSRKREPGTGRRLLTLWQGDANQ